MTKTPLLDAVNALKTGPRRWRAPEGECITCDRARANDDKTHPSHDASPGCQSGKHNHCTCDACF